MDNVTYRLGIKPFRVLAFCIVLARLSSPTHYKNTLHIFACSQAYQSLVFNSVIGFLYGRFKNILYWNQRRLILETIKSYARAIERIGSREHIWGFVDGTLRSICQPEQEQLQSYTGYKKCHAIKFQDMLRVL